MRPRRRSTRCARSSRASAPGAERASRIAAVLFVTGALFVPGTVNAHLGSSKLVRIEPSAEGATILVDLDPIDIAYELEADDPDHPDVDALAGRGAEIRAWAEGAFSMRTEGGACAADAAAISVVPIESLRMERAIRVQIGFTCPTPRRAMVFRDDAIFDTDRQHESIVRVGQRPTILRVGRQEVAVGVPPSFADTLLTFLAQGAIHLVTGYDHVLFLLLLLLVAGEVAARDGRKAAIRDVALIVTAFTVGHSVTLIAAALDVVTLPSRLVESAIAASIIAVAVWNVVRPDARVGLRWVAAAFGLIHGFGFSSVLRELILPAGERVAALLAFNVGIELAQLVIVILAVPALGWAAKRPWYRDRVVRGGSIVTGLIATVWLVQRAFGL